MNLDQSELADLAEEYGGRWGLKHSERLIHLVKMLGEGLEYDPGIIEAAAYLHDWGDMRNGWLQVLIMHFGQWKLCGII